MAFKTNIHHIQTYNTDSDNSKFSTKFKKKKLGMLFHLPIFSVLVFIDMIALDQMIIV